MFYFTFKESKINESFTFFTYFTFWNFEKKMKIFTILFFFLDVPVITQLEHDLEFLRWIEHLWSPCVTSQDLLIISLSLQLSGCICIMTGPPSLLMRQFSQNVLKINHVSTISRIHLQASSFIQFISSICHRPAYVFIRNNVRWFQNSSIHFS